jgi:hypothetical protein
MTTTDDEHEGDVDTEGMGPGPDDVDEAPPDSEGGES